MDTFNRRRSQVTPLDTQVRVISPANVQAAEEDPAFFIVYDNPISFTEISNVDVESKMVIENINQPNISAIKHSVPNSDLSTINNVDDEIKIVFEKGNPLNISAGPLPNFDFPTINNVNDESKMNFHDQNDFSTLDEVLKDLDLPTDLGDLDDSWNDFINGLYASGQQMSLEYYDETRMENKLNDSNLPRGSVDLPVPNSVLSTINNVDDEIKRVIEKGNPLNISAGPLPNFDLPTINNVHDESQMNFHDHNDFSTFDEALQDLGLPTDSADLDVSWEDYINGLIASGQQMSLEYFNESRMENVGELNDSNLPTCSGGLYGISMENVQETIDSSLSTGSAILNDTWM